MGDQNTITEGERLQKKKTHTQKKTHTHANTHTQARAHIYIYIYTRTPAYIIYSCNVLLRYIDNHS